MNEDYPIVAIIGRPNVGKSTLFNRLIGRRRAIIDPTPGVTRDILFDDMNINGKNITLIDTGGLTESDDVFNKLVQEKTKNAIEYADLIIFLCEYGNSAPIEKEYLSLVRKSSKKALLVINKCDSYERDLMIGDFYEYGLGEPIAISSTHNRNIDILLEKIIEYLPYENKSYNNQENSNDTKEEVFEKEKNLIRIAILGKPNVGKSSLLNRILGKEYSIVSHIPGTTRDVIEGFFQFSKRNFAILDTAGIRRKNKVKENIEYYSVNRALKAIEHSDIIFLLIDSLEQLSEQDKKITDQIIKHGKPLILVLTKSDLTNNTVDTFKKLSENLRFKFPIINFVPIEFTSSVKGTGIKLLLKNAIKIYDNSKIKITTSKLNDFIHKVVREYSPSSKKGVLKVYYGVQSSVNPAEFIFFINKKRLIANNYKQYIINKLRKEFSYEGIPIKIIFREKNKK